MRLYIIAAVMLVVLATGFSGCSKRSEPAAAEETVKTEQELQQEAQQDITADNMDEELTKLEEEIDSEIASEP